MFDRKHWPVCSLEGAAELAATMAVIAALVFNPGTDVNVDKLAERAVHAVHIFVVVLAAAYANAKV